MLIEIVSAIAHSSRDRALHWFFNDLIVDEAQRWRFRLARTSPLPLLQSRNHSTYPSTVRPCGLVSGLYVRAIEPTRSADGNRAWPTRPRASAEERPLSP